MKVAVCLYGFLNVLENVNALNKLTDIFDNTDDLEIDVFYAVPTTLNEFDENAFDIEILRNGLKNMDNVCDVFIEPIPYNHCKYFKDIEFTRFPIFGNTQMLPTNRVISTMDSITKSSKLFYLMGNKDYDISIITRLDTLKTVKRIGVLETNEHKMFVWRGETKDVEDRFFYEIRNCGNNLKELKSLYDWVLNKEYVDSHFYCENLIGRFFIEKLTHDVLSPQSSVHVPINVNRAKYDKGVLDKYNNIRKNCLTN